jgi:uncharacterized protein YegL
MAPIDNKAEGIQSAECNGLPKVSLDFIWVVDCSAAMQGWPVEALNFAIAECEPALRDFFACYPLYDVFVRVLRFSDGASWHLDSRTHLDVFRWHPVCADATGSRNLSAAFRELSKSLTMPGHRAIPPVIVLMLGGTPTDDWEPGFAEFLKSQWLRKSLRIGIAVGQHADMHVMKHFMGTSSSLPLLVDEVRDLVHSLKPIIETDGLPSDPAVSDSLLCRGQMITTGTTNAVCVVAEFIGCGHAGEVYAVLWKGRRVALKWFYPYTATPERRPVIQALTCTAPPSAFWLWPLDIASQFDGSGFGYVMPRREDRFIGVSDLMLAKANPSIRILSTVGIGICQRLAELNAAGYRMAIDFGSFFFDPVNSDVLGSCDGSLIALGESQQACAEPEFMAPELLRREPNAQPSMYTDLHSLAVLLFYIFMKSHPLAGRKQLAFKAWDAPAREKLFGVGPVFIFDPSDTSNEAVDESVDPYKTAGHLALKNWPIYPRFFKDQFIYAFTKGLADPTHGRVRESQWVETLSRLRDSWFKCACGAENFYDESEARACWKCGQQPQLPPQIKIGKARIVLTPGAKIYQHHLVPGAGVDVNQVAAEVAPHPTQKNLFGLLNCGQSKWIAHATAADGVTRQMDVEPGKKMLIAQGVEIDFGRVSGKVMV